MARDVGETIDLDNLISDLVGVSKHEEQEAEPTIFPNTTHNEPPI